MEWLKRQEEEQVELRVAYEAFARGPTLPREIISTVLSHIPSSNEVRWKEKPTVYLDGLLPHAVLKPSLLLPHYEDPFHAEWTLEEIGKQTMKQTVLDDALLIKHTELRVETMWYRAMSLLRPLMVYPHQWKKIDIRVDWFAMNNFIDVFGPCLPRLEELTIDSDRVTSSDAVTPFQGSQLKKVNLLFSIFSAFPNAGVLDFVTSLTLNWDGSRRFRSDDAFKKALVDLPDMLSQLPCLQELSVWRMKCTSDDLAGLPRVASTSLRSLDVYGYPDSSIAFLNLFSACHIDHVGISADILQEVERLFGDAQRVCIRVSLFVR